MSSEWKDLFDLASLPGLLSVRRVEAKVEQRFSIIPDDKDPKLKIEDIDGSGKSVGSLTLNLSALDHLIGKLIEMRDHMDHMRRKNDQTR